MKTLWTAVSIVAVANLLALVAIGAFLIGSDRVNTDRVQAVRDLLSETVSEQAARERRVREAEAAEAEAILAASPDAQLGAPPQTPGAVPMSSPEMMRRHIEATRLDRQRIERTKREIEDLTRTLHRERVAIDRDREAYERERRAFEAHRAEIESIEGSEQFTKSLSVMQGLKPEPAKEILQQLIAGVDADGLGTGDRENGMMRAVLYLDALPARQRTKLMNAITEDDPALATELLERLRVKGLNPRTRKARACDGRNTG